ncbi:MAG: DUF58 domain-containing protein [Agarilytica sp.]
MIIVLAVVLSLYFVFAITAGLAKSSGLIFSLENIAIVVSLIFLAALVLDAVAVLKQSRLSVERKVLGSVAVERWMTVSLRVHHPFRYSGECTLFDDIENIDGQAEFEDQPVNVALQPNKVSIISYRLKINRRGPFKLGLCHVQVLSPLRMWNKRYRAGEPSLIKVYPDFSAITHYTLLATDNHESQIGIKRKPRRGEGLEFLQLRNYRNGDSLRKIDWKATSRRQNLISKEYQDERDQNIVLLIDSGRRMRSKDDNLSHFDHSLNAMLLVSYLALRQGDSVSVMNLGASQRWVAGQKGMAAMKTILNAMYDLEAENSATDYVAAAEKLMRLQRKRSLVILVTNSRDEEVDELLMASHLIKQRHLFLLANIREAFVDQLQQKEVEGLDDALLYAGVNRYVQQRQDVHQKIKNRGVFSIDCVAKELAVNVANSYLEIKRSGAL